MDHGLEKLDCREGATNTIGHHRKKNKPKKRERNHNFFPLISPIKLTKEILMKWRRRRRASAYNNNNYQEHDCS
jgi:hypothetical protein